MDWENNLHFGDNLDEMLDRTNGPTVDSKRFYEEGKQPLYPGCKKFSRLSFIVRLYSLKCVHGITESGFGDILELIRDAFPEENIPLSFYAAKNVIKELGLDYKKIHACPNHCMLYWGEDEKEDSCKTCGLSRWIVREKKGTSDSNPEKVIHKVPANVMRKFLDSDHKWRFDKRRFNRQIELGQPPAILSETDIEDLLSNFQNQFGKKKKEPGQKKVKKVDSPFKKKSVFFNLPYWSHNLHRHNLDVMYIEKNVCDNILGTLLNMAGKTKDHVNARLDLKELGIRKALHPVRSLDGKHLEIRAAVFDMTNKEKDLFCAVLKNVKLPYGSASNISRYVHTKERKISGYKSHDAHFLLHYLLQFAVEKSLKPEVAKVFIRLGAFLRGIWRKVIDLNELRRLQQEIMEILCQFENIFVNAFFDIMVHLLVHLCSKVQYGGPAHVRSMFPIERYLCKLKSYVRNRSKPEGSIAEGYLAEEGLTFCSRFLGGDSRSKITKPAKFGSCPEKLEYHIGTRRNKDGKSIHLKESQWMAIHRYILFNNGNKEIESLIEEHRALVVGQAKLKRYKREREHNEDFWKWMKEQVTNKLNISRELEVLAMGPNRAAKEYSGYVINGYRFHSKNRDAKCKTQNGGVFLTALTTSFASSKDENPTVGNVNYYGAIEEIVEVDYWGEFSVVVFKCCWYQEEKDVYGLTRVNFNKLCQQSDPYVLASQVQQIFYIEDPVDKMLYNVIKRLPRDWCDVENDNVNEGQDDTVLHDIHLESQIDEASWCRDDVPKRQVPIQPDEVNEPD
ncbi:uncharacterized protein LOC141699855 [Apium graveolens]|uniref:uncharacterized protein LOC141699855 n=1 Tax=Apium graveolens TaxID=4045 RepID=UPI003D7B6BA8